ncbi:cytochrome c [Sphingobium sp. AS12]|uniref:cytochrome c n=1 Tax=Sphingobium sp. AS12 TaxID=2849495 RepID=UPI001C3188E7|nr:cytochrome c [Sphingobium sp. AS12]MBV2149137.1 cytochrome c [Sphingobium sp. AS12]
MTQLNRWLAPVLLAVILIQLVMAMRASDYASADPSPAKPPIAAGSGDLRTPVVVTSDQAAHVLGEMRALMAVLRDLQAARATNDAASLSAAALQGSPKGARAMPDGLRTALPADFQTMSKAMRQDFAEASQAAGNRQITTADAAVGRAMNACIACHESYRLVGR